MIDFGVREVPPAGFVCRHGNGPEATKSAAFDACPSCMADLMNMRFVAPRTHPGWGFRLSPQGWDVGGSGGGVCGIWRTLAELESWEQA